MPRLSKIGAASLAAFGWTAGVKQPYTGSYLSVAGGGGGGLYGGGGGAGGLLTGTYLLIPKTVYTITIGAGIRSHFSISSKVSMSEPKN